MFRSWTLRVAAGLIIVGALAVLWLRSNRRPSTLEPPVVGSAEPALTVEPTPSAPPPSGAEAQLPVAAAASNAAVEPTAAQDDATLMNRLRAVQDSDPVLARQLAEEGQRRFPNSADAAERAALGIKSLARQGRISEARGEAERMVDQYPGTKWALEVERNTGAHPHQ